MNIFSIKPIVLSAGISILYSTNALALTHVSQCRNTQEFKQKILSDTTTKQHTDYLKYDFSKIWLDKSVPYLGSLGSQRYKMDITLLSATQDNHRPDLYRVLGSVVFKGRKSAFVGTITIKQIRSYTHPDFGTDDEMKNSLHDQGVAIADYSLKENSAHSNSGTFKGTLATSWYINKQGQLKADNYIPSDSYANSQFYGTWTNFRTNATAIAVWGQHRIPCSGDLDIGAGEFSVSPKYKKNGW